MAKSKITINILGDPASYTALSLNARHKDTPANQLGFGPTIIYKQWLYHLPYNNVRLVNTTIVKAGDTNTTALNLYNAILADNPSFTNDYTIVRTGSTIVITAKSNDIIFATYFVPPYLGYEVIIENETLIPDTAKITSTVFSEYVLNPCSKVLVTITTDVQLTELGTDLSINSNPYSFALDRAVTETLIGRDINAKEVSFTFDTPPLLEISSFVLDIKNTNIEASVTIISNVDLDLEYKIDGGDWQTLNKFYVPLSGAYTLHIRDQYGCEITEDFITSNFVLNQPKVVEKKYCGGLHELNKGKYLNLCGKQKTMKIGFICNASPQMIKIFKHIQMILNTDYSVKNITIKTSSDQERFVPGDHMVYRIRESMHSVPLKNPRDYADLRGSWAYIEIEIESINNKKVDLFSAIMHLRKSSI